MKTGNNEPDPHGQRPENDNPPGYPLYPPGEDIYSHAKLESDIDPEDISRRKTSNMPSGRKNEKNFEKDVSGADLDVPGAELDDDQEDIGSEDEENNHYSRGQD